MTHEVFKDLGITAVIFVSVLNVGYAALPNPGTNPADAQIVVDGTSEILVEPTIASFSVEVNSSAATANTAREDSALIVKMVMNALTGADLHRDEIRHTSLSVGPKWQNDDETRRQKRTAFEATNRIELRTTRLEKVGQFIDAALSAGATGMSEVAFSVDDTATLRRQALSDAVMKARQDAEALARAGGGTLGALLQLSTEEASTQPGVQFNEIQVTASRRSVSTEIIPTQIKVTAKVIGRWRFVSTMNAK